MAGGRSAGLAAVIVAGSAFVVLATLVPSGPSVADALDPAWRAALPGWALTVLDGLNLAGGLPFWVSLVLMACAFAWRDRRLAFEVAASSVLIEALTTVVRVVVDRPRPPLGPNAELIVTAGFPSGHVTRTVVYMAALLVVLPAARQHPRAASAAGVVVVALMALARVAASAHYATDTVGGVLLGALVVAGWSFVRRRAAAAAPSSPGARSARSATHRGC